MALFTLVHVLISLAAILAGFVVVVGMAGAKPLPGWTRFFLATTILTSVTGFLFPFHHFMASHAVGILSLLALGIAVVALYRRHLAGAWRRTYVVTAVLALWFNTFVLVAQLFQKVPALHALAPTGSEPPFGAAQGVVLVGMIVLGIRAARGFKAPPAAG